MTETQSNPSLPTKKKSSFLKKIILTLLFVIAVGGVVWGTWSYKMYLGAKDQVLKLSSIEGQQELAKKEIQKVLDQVKKHIKLPEDEEPVIATVTNAADLEAEQVFYKGVKNGDKVIIYQKAQKAILYNPTDDVLVNVGPVYLDQNQPQPTGEGQATDEKTVASSPAPQPVQTTPTPISGEEQPDITPAVE